jgi:hypothetical protein
MKKAENQKILIEKFDNKSIEREDKYENVMRNEKIQEYERLKKFEEITERMKRIDEMKYD